MSIYSSIVGSRSSGSSDSVHSIANTVTSTAPLAAAYRPPQKDYEAAFAMLQGQYGMSGDFPGPSVHLSTVKKKKQKQPKLSPIADIPSGGASSSTPSRHPTGTPSSHPIPRVPDQGSRSSLVSPSAETPPTQSPRSSATGVEASTPVEQSDGDKGKTSGLSKLKKIFGAWRKGNK
ncbi:hypothetical protein B0H11DRAFT_1976523 [Mycena galericulata]|nr:hypothetical protein B0H11DRAFT_1976523 [Mycena galericulata]